MSSGAGTVAPAQAESTLPPIRNPEASPPKAHTQTHEDNKVPANYHKRKRRHHGHSRKVRTEHHTPERAAQLPHMS